MHIVGLVQYCYTCTCSVLLHQYIPGSKVVHGCLYSCRYVNVDSVMNQWLKMGVDTPDDHSLHDVLSEVGAQGGVGNGGREAF